MIGVEWDSISLAGAFLLGVLFATFAVLRVVRAVIILFDDGPRARRPRWRRPDDDDGEPSGPPAG